MSTKAKKCIYCDGTKVVKDGHRGRVQKWLCRVCGRRFVVRKNHIQNIVTEYVFHKQTLRELSVLFNKDTKTLQRILDAYTPPTKVHTPRSVHLVVDALRFGSAEYGTEWCVVVFRDSDTKENVWWGYGGEETQSLYLEGRHGLEQKGYTILSVTGDGFSGIRSSFYNVPFQMCHVHMERIVIKGTTRNPQLKAGEVLLALVRTLHDPKMTEEVFRHRLLLYKETYFTFLHEKSHSVTTGDSWYTHEPLLHAFKSLYRFFPFLFTYTYYASVPRTTNSLEGHFAHVRDVVNIHRGLTRLRMQKVLTCILLCSTIAPTEDALRDVFK
jgi:hypothetical protein